MNFGEHIAAQFPSVSWTGKSAIHRSLAGQFGIDQEFADVKSAIEVAHCSAMGLSLWEFLQETFEMDWQVSGEEFRAIILTDVYRHLMHEGDTKHPTKLKNPSTGNVFHRLATRGDIVGGVRIWSEGSLSLRFGYRFRLAGMAGDDHETVPVIARQKALQSIAATTEVLQKFKINEPSVEEVVKTRKKVYVK